MQRAAFIGIGIALIFFAIYQIRRYRDIFHPIANQAFMVGAIIGARVFFVLYGEDGWANFTRQADLIPVFWDAMIFYLGFFALAAIVYIAVKNRGLFRRISFELRTFGQATPTYGLLAFPYVITGVLALGYFAASEGFSAFFGNVAEERKLFEGNYILLYGLIAPVIGACIFYGLRLRGDKRLGTLLFMIASAALAFAGAVLTGLRGYILLIAISFLAMRAFSRRKIDYSRLALYVLLVAVSLPIMDGVVYGGLENIRGKGSAGVSDYYADRWKTLLPYAYGRFYTLEGTARTLYLIDEGKVEFDNGRLIYEFPKTFLPTAVVGTKISVTQTLTRTFFADRYGTETETSALTSLPAFFWWQLGWIGYVISAVLYGLFMAYWVKIYETPGIANGVLIAVTYPYFFMFFVGHTAALAQLIYLHVMLFPILRPTLTKRRSPAPVAAPTRPALAPAQSS